MSDLNHYIGGDLSLSATGDFLKVDGTIQGQQRVLRRLLTNPATLDSNGNVIVPADYIFHPAYGAGLPRMVGDTLNIPKIRALIRGQIFLEACVSKNPEPIITVTAIQGGVSVYIHYNDAITGKPVALAFDVNR
ncbi:phage tail protein [Glaciimonas sp. PCH181]|nr:phage tail protein [Glaciimonas sp. PCH181]PUA19573.1 phage tail protein [Glaciimonas sp. PCH181]